MYQKAKCDKPVKRLWISSLTDESIREGFAHLQDAKDFDNLYYAGLSRAIGDWILGMNATRLYTLKYSSNTFNKLNSVLSIGRVQTPTLALIVNRQLEIENFVPQDYWEIKTKYRDTTFNSTKGKFKTEADAATIVETIKQHPLVVTQVSKKKGKEAPPRLFDLTSLQVECNKKLGYSADETLRLIQSLYEKKATTYPRVDTTYLSEDIYPKIEGIMQGMRPYAAITGPVLAGKIPKSKKVFDNTKVTDHHAIIPTNVDPSSVFMTREEKLVYDLVARRFVAAFYPDCEFSTTTVMARVAEHEFKATGKEILKDGWRVIYAKDKARDEEKKDDDDNAVLPTFVEGESGPHEPSLLKKSTQPPKYYTEGTLLRAMETAGRLVDDETLREAMKENGIGRPSTRASIIEILHKRKYIAKQRKSLVATPAGMQLIATIKEELLKSAKLTGLWENKLRKIERGQFSAAQFIDELKTLVNGIVINVLSDNSSTTITVPADEEKPSGKKKAATGEKKPRKPRLKSIEEIPCPLCGDGHLIKGKSAYGCSKWQSGCAMRLPFDTYASDLTPAKLNTLIKKNFKNPAGS